MCKFFRIILTAFNKLFLRLKRKPECVDKRMRYSSSYSSTSDSSASSPLSQYESGFSEEEEIQQDLDLQGIPSNFIPPHLMPAISEIVDSDAKDARLEITLIGLKIYLFVNIFVNLF